MPLHRITKEITEENAAIRVQKMDNVAVARVALSAGQVLRFGEDIVTVREHIPAGHKVALAAIPASHRILRYGETMGRSSRTIEPGQHVHTHNVAFEEIPLGYEFPEIETALPEVSQEIPVFLGYSRGDGRAGTRNYIAVVAASNCAAHTVEAIADSFRSEHLPHGVDGIVALPHGEGCAHAIGPDLDQLHKTVAGIINHPNVAGAVIVGLGCETNQVGQYLGSNAARPERVVGLTLQSSGGTRGTVTEARRQIATLLEQASTDTRLEIPASKLMLGLQCGGSDSFSGITANPALGACADLLVRLGGTVVLAETTEIFGAEHLLVRRSRNRAVGEKLLNIIRGYREYLDRFGGSFDDNPSPGNKEGGLTNILEKSLGAVAKAGTSPLMDAVGYAERVDGPGLVFMNTPGYDPPSLAGLAAGGANLLAFTTGRGSATGFPTVPVLKIATNSNTFYGMRDNMDINAGKIADGDSSIAEVGQEILQALLRVASGERTAAEQCGHMEFVPWRIGPVL